MGTPLILMILSASSIFGSAGFDIPSLSAVSAVFHLNLGTPPSQATSPMSSSPSFKRRGAIAPSPEDALESPAPEYSSPTKVSAPENTKIRKYHRAKDNSMHLVPTPSNIPQAYIDQSPYIAPLHSTSPSVTMPGSPAPVPSLITTTPFIISPTRAFTRKKATPPPSPFLALAPPPLNKDCSLMTCAEPLTYMPPGSPCGCVLPIEVRLQLGVALYTFFPLVSELAKEIASSVSLNQSQVRVMGANAASQPQEKTIVLIHLVPLGQNFNRSTVSGVYNKFWQKMVLIRPSLFGAYEVIYVQYPGLPPSPPSVPSDLATMENFPYPNQRSNGNPAKPIGVDISGRKRKNSNRSMVVVIVLSSITALVVFMVAAWLLVLKCGYLRQPEKNQYVSESSPGKPSGDVVSRTGAAMLSPSSMSLSSSMLAYTGTAKIFSLDDMERATDDFNPMKILGEGGFGLVYSGILDNGQKVAVKVLKRDDRQGTREFLAEVEMLSRLHHRNLVKLIGICTEEHSQCLVYELVPNGSVESHLHGVDKERAPLDWGARMKIALGSARGLAYLHEDSSPRVIHRDFKSSNILLEHDFTPKVSDFGLARTAMDEASKHISTHVMGTFGYLAPEYAMTGHVLVKSDVYSYGVVLLELLTGRKPVDLSQPLGQENLVAWARPLLTTKEGLKAIIDPLLGPDLPFDGVSKVAAIASMCVQPEVSHRPFMGEVVQALKLVCDEFDETKESNISRSCSHDDVFLDIDSNEIVDDSAGLIGDPGCGTHYIAPRLEFSTESTVALSTPDLVTDAAGFEGQFGTSRREFNSAPLKSETRKPFWKRLKG